MIPRDRVFGQCFLCGSDMEEPGPLFNGRRVYWMHKTGELDCLRKAVVLMSEKLNRMELAEAMKGEAK